MIKIFTKRSFEFRNQRTGEKVRTPFMGFISVEDWARKDPIFISGTKTGSISIVQDTVSQKILENGGDPDSEFEELSAKAAEVKIPHSAKIGKDKLKAAITENDTKV